MPRAASDPICRSRNPPPVRETHPDLGQSREDGRELRHCLSGHRPVDFGRKTSKALREKVMLGVTAINDFRYCAWGHSHWAEGIPLEAVNQILSLQDDSLQAHDPARRRPSCSASTMPNTSTRSIRTRSRVFKAASARLRSGRSSGTSTSLRWPNPSGNTVDVVLERLLGKGRPITVVEAVAGVGLAPVLLLLVLLVKLGKLVGADKRRAKRNRVASDAQAGRASKRRFAKRGNKDGGPRSARSTHSGDPGYREVTPMSLRKLKAKHDEKMKSKLPAGSRFEADRGRRSRRRRAIEDRGGDRHRAGRDEHSVVGAEASHGRTASRQEHRALLRHRRRAGKAKEVLDAEGFKAFNGGSYKGVKQIVRKLTA